MTTPSPQARDPRLIVALDYPQAAPALALAARLDPALCRLKVGKELFTAAGPALVEEPASVTVLNPGQRLRVDDWGKLLIESAS